MFNVQSMDEVRDKAENFFIEMLSYVNKTSVRSADSKYNMSILANQFHKIPHIDTKLNFVNQTFDPEDNQYLESLGIIVAIPGFWLILTLLFFLIFFLCRCCDVNNNNKPQKLEKLTCCKCCLLLFAIITLSVISIGFIGNIYAHNGIIKVQQSSSELVRDIEQLRNFTMMINTELEQRMFTNIKRLQDKLIHPLVRDREALERLHNILNNMKNNLTRSVQNVFNIQKQLKLIENPGKSFNSFKYENEENERNYYEIFIKLPSMISSIEAVRWPATFAIFIGLLFICIILMCGVCKHSRCLLIIFSVLGLLSLVVCYVLTSQNLGIAVAGSDFCVQPRPFLKRELNKFMNDSLADYYLNCPENSLPIFQASSESIRSTLKSLDPEIAQLSNICLKYCGEHEVTSMIRLIRTAKNTAIEHLAQIETLSNCQELHQDYLKIMNSLCKDVLEGFSLMLATSALTGILFTLLVLCASHTWIKIKNKNKYHNLNGSNCNTDNLNDYNEETDPFIPTASASSTVSSANKRHGLRNDIYGSNRQRFSTPPSPATPFITNNRDDQLQFLTPPPAYSSQVVPDHSMHMQHMPSAPQFHPHMNYVVSYRKN